MQEGLLFSITGSSRNRCLSLTVQNCVLFVLVEVVVVYLSIILTLEVCGDAVTGSFLFSVNNITKKLPVNQISETTAVTTTVAVAIVPVVVVIKSSSSSSTGNSSSEVGMLTPRDDGSPHKRGFKEVALKISCLWIEHMISCC